MENKPITFPAMQHKFLEDLKYVVSCAYEKSGYEDIQYPLLIEYLKSAVDMAQQLHSMKQDKKILENEWKKTRGILKKFV